MKKIAGFLGLIGGLCAAAWLLRDRLVSLAAPREMEPPQFRPIPKQERVTTPAPAQSGDDLKQIKGIGPVYEQALRAFGVRSFAELSQVDASDLADHLGISEIRIAGWAEQARNFSG